MKLEKWTTIWLLLDFPMVIFRLKSGLPVDYLWTTIWTTKSAKNTYFYGGMLEL